MTIDQLLQLVPQLGTTGVLAGVAYQLWRERTALQVALIAEKQARLDDAKAVTPQMLALAERVHAIIDILERKP